MVHYSAYKLAQKLPPSYLRNVIRPVAFWHSYLVQSIPAYTYSYIYVLEPCNTHILSTFSTFLISIQMATGQRGFYELFRIQEERMTVRKLKKTDAPMVESTTQLHHLYWEWAASNKNWETAPIFGAEMYQIHL